MESTTSGPTYELLRRIKAGGMAEVFLARRRGIEGFERFLVLKRILPAHIGKPRVLERFLDEAHLAATLTHPHIVQVLDLGRDGDQVFMVMEYLDGHDLTEVYRKLRERDELFPIHHLLRITCTALEALHHAHERRVEGRRLAVVHRDVTPSNIVLSFDGGVKLIDFGVATSDVDRRPQTRPGAVIGKVGFMAPEQLRGEPVDRRADVFGLGSTLFLLLTGRLPYEDAEDPLESLALIDSARIRDLAELRPGIDEELVSIVRQAVAPRPDDRFATALEMQIRLEQVMARRSLFSCSSTLAEFMSELFSEEKEESRRAATGLVTIGDASALSAVEILHSSIRLAPPLESPSSTDPDERTDPRPTRRAVSSLPGIGPDEFNELDTAKGLPPLDVHDLHDLSTELAPPPDDEDPVTPPARTGRPNFLVDASGPAEPALADRARSHSSSARAPKDPTQTQDIAISARALWAGGVLLVITILAIILLALEAKT